MKRLIISVLITALALALVGCSNDKALSAPSQETIDLLSQEAMNVDVELPSFTSNSPDIVKENYLLSYEHSEVLEYMPCFCGCVNRGHKSNFNCFIKQKSSDEVNWDEMGLNCDICNSIARESIALYKEGNSLYDIRNYIDNKFGDYGPSTKTPMPPKEA